MKKKTIGLLALGGGLFLLANKAGKNTPPAPAPAPTPTPIVVLPPSGDTVPDVIVTDGNTAVSGIKEDARELSKSEYINLKKADWQQLLKAKLATGKELSTVTQELWDLWNNNNNPYLPKFDMPTGLLMGLVVKNLYAVEPAKIGTITWSSTPVYPTWDNWWNNVDNIWTCAQWKAWHQALEQRYNSTQMANSVFEQAWFHPYNNIDWITGISNNIIQTTPFQSFLQTSVDCRYDCAFVEYLYSKDIDVSHLLSRATCTLSNVAKNIIGAVGDIGAGLATVARIAKIALPVIAVALAYSWTVGTQKRLSR